ncbi:MAG: ribosome recycling factor [Phycisphaerales bacterium]
MTLAQIVAETTERMDKTVEYLAREMRGIRTGRATTALVDTIKVDYYGSSTDLRELAQINVPEPTQITIKLFDPGSKGTVVKAIETANLGFNPTSEGNTIIIRVPAPSADRRKQLSAQARKMAEDARVAIRNERRDANKEIEKLEKDKSNEVSEDQAKAAKSDIDELTKSHTARIDDLCEKKCAETAET